MQPWPDAPGTSSYHAIFHDHATFGGHAYSADGIRWTYSDVVPFSNRVEYTDGTIVRLQRRERPHLIFDAAGYITHLTNGVQPPPSAERGPPSRHFQNDCAPRPPLPCLARRAAQPLGARAADTYTLVQPVKSGA